MELDANNAGFIQNSLAKAETQDCNWATFDWDYHGQIKYLQGFESANDAIKFCEQNNNYFDYAQKQFAEAKFHYMPIEYLFKAVAPTLVPHNLTISLDTYMEQLAAQQVGLMRSQDLESLYPAMQAGNVFPVVFDQMIDPEKEVDRFMIVAHQHAGHQVYEIGHSVRIVETLNSFGKAESLFNELQRQYREYEDKQDYQLIGLYRGQEYVYDLEGGPENHSGLLLKSAYYQYDTEVQGKAWQVQTVNELDEPKSLRHFLYAQYDNTTEKFRLLDDRLREVKPEEIRISTYPSQFINETLTIKQLEIMNEQSYDYVKDQLKFLGFGDEIAKPLREQMEKGEQDFTLNHSRDFGQDKTTSVLHFSKGDDVAKDMTFLNRFDMTLKQPGKEDLSQTFFVGKQYNYTLQERYNMMDGRYVYREQPKLMPVEENGQTKMKPTGETYMGWKGLNFKETHEDGNFKTKTMFWNHAKEIHKYPVKELAEPYDRNRLLASMEKGNKANVTILRNEQEIKGTVVANPNMQRFDFYDSNGQSLFVKQVDKQKIAKTETQEQTQNQNAAQGKSEGVQQGGQQEATREKPEAVQHGAHHDQAKAENMGQGTSASQATGKESQKSEVANEAKNETSQRKRQGVKI